METNVFLGTWKRVTGSKRFESVEINEQFQLKVSGESPLQLRVDEQTGALVSADDDVSVTYWQRSVGGKTQNLLLGIVVEPGEGAGRPWTLWGGKLSIALVYTHPIVFKPSLKPVEFLRGVWRVRAQEGQGGGRYGGYVMVVSGGKPDDDGDFSSETRYWLCYSEGPDGPWIRYDVMTFNTDTGSLDSLYGHRSISFLEARRPSRRVIYAMFYDVPPEARMPFEPRLSAALGGDDGSGAWGAEGG